MVYHGVNLLGDTLFVLKFVTQTFSLLYLRGGEKKRTGSLTFYLRMSDVLTRVDFSSSTSKVHSPVLNMVLLQEVTIYCVDTNTLKFWRAKYPSHRRNLGRGSAGEGAGKCPSDIFFYIKKQLFWLLG
jgi:hypothetical protein